MKEEILKVRKYKAGYEVRTVRVSMDGSPSFEVRMAFTPDGHFIGDSKWAYSLVVKSGIKPELADPTHCVCSIGFCEADQKWYGWSHRAMYGYGVGDVVEAGTIPTESGWTDEYLAEHPEEDRRVPDGFIVNTLDDAKRVAIAFAQAVS